MTRTGDERRALLSRAQLCLVAGTESGGPGWFPQAARALETGLVGVLQLREKDVDDDAFRRVADTLRPLAERHGALLILNDRVALAPLCGADGAHVGEHDLPPGLARLLLGPDLLLGVSTHDAAEVEAARARSVDYGGLGPCHATTTKALARAPGGPDLVRRAAVSARGWALFAIGGVTPENAPALVAAGARRLAVGASVLRAPDPAAAVRALADALAGAPDRPA